MKQIFISCVSMIFFFITAVLAYTKINKVNYNQKENNSYLIVNLLFEILLFVVLKVFILSKFFYINKAMKILEKFFII